MGCLLFERTEASSSLNICRRNVIKNKIDASLTAFVHDAVAFLIINLIDLTDLEPKGAPINHESYPRVSIDRDVDPVAVMKRRMTVVMRFYDATWFKPGCHGADDGSPRRIMVLQDLMH